MSKPVPRTVATTSQLDQQPSVTHSSPLPGAPPGKPPAQITADPNLRLCSPCGKALSALEILVAQPGLALYWRSLPLLRQGYEPGVAPQWLTAPSSGSRAAW